MPRQVSLLALAFLATGLAAGCGGAKAAAPTVDEFAPTAQVQGLPLPFDAFSPSLAARYTIENARDRLTRDCMTAKGQDWKVIQRPMGLKDLRNRRRYGVIEMKIAERYGYHVPEGLLTPADVEH